MPINIDPRAGAGIGVNPTGLDYPFVQPSADIAGLLVDFWFSRAAYTNTTGLHISWIRGLGIAFESEQSISSIEGDGTHPVDVIVRDAEDQVVFDSTDASEYTGRNYGNRLRIHEWRDDFVFCRIIQHAAFASEAEIRSIPDEIEPENGILDPRSYSLHPLGVPNLANVDGENNDFDVSNLRGALVLRAQNNIVFSVERDLIGYGLRRVTRITVSAEPGTGAGPYDNCEDADAPPAVKRINGIPMSGNVQINLDPCYWLRPLIVYELTTPTHRKATNPTPYTLVLGNDCSPCYTCDDIANTYKAVVNLRTQGEQAAAIFTDTVDGYHANRDRWLSQKNCRENMAAQITALSHDCTEAEVRFSICNTKPYCLADVSATLEIIQTFEGVSSILEDSNYEISHLIRRDGRGHVALYEMEGNNAYEIRWDEIEVGGAGSIGFHLHFFEPPAGSITIAVGNITTRGEPLSADVGVSFTADGCE